MKKFLKLSILALAISAISSSANAATSNATVVAQIAVTENTLMNFGKFSSSASAGTITLTPAASTSRSSTGGVSLLSTPTPSAGIFTVTGDNGATYAITLPTTVTLTSGANNMTVNTFTSSPTPTGTLTGGTQTLYVGAKLNVSASQPTGTYTGTYTVTVAYN